MSATPEEIQFRALALRLRNAAFEEGAFEHMEHVSDAKLDRADKKTRSALDALLEFATAAASPWQPIETAPTGKKGIAFMRLAWGHDSDKRIGDGVRIGDTFYASGVFFCAGGVKPIEIREVQVNPTHWMPLPAAPVSEQGEA